MVDYLCNHAIDQDMTVACFYYDFASREAQSPTNMLGSLLSQLLSALEAIPEDIRKRFRSQKKLLGGRGVQLQDIVKMFPAVSSLQRTFICIDALDECIPEHQVEVLDALGQIFRRSPNTRMFMTGRSHILGAVERELGEGATSVHINSRADDIVTYLGARLKKDTTPEVMDGELRKDIMKSIPDGASETYVVLRGLGNLSGSYTERFKYRFLLVSLNVDAILRGTTIHRRRERLNAIGVGSGLEGAYEVTLERIRTQEGEKAKLAMTALMWICYSERPLLVDELCHALGVEIGCAHFNHSHAPATETLLTCCQGLVTVDKEASTFRLTHHTLREYLCTHCDLFPRARLVMAETCLSYLNSDKAKALSAKPQPDLSSMPFLKYCSRYWGTHAKRELSDCARLLAVELLDQYENHVAASTLFEQILDRDYFREVNAPSLFSGLHCGSFFGIVELMRGLLGVKDCGANQRDSAGMTPLTWAAWAGNGEAVELLIGRGAVDPGKPDNEGRTPLSWAAIKGHESVVKQLLDLKEVDPDKLDNDGSTPLSWAAFGGHESVVKHLLDKEGVNPDKPDNEGNTPLLWAADKGHESVVKQLLDKEGVNPDKPNSEGNTPLSQAANKGHESVVKQLLDKEGVNPDKPDNEGKTPLSQAAVAGHELVVKLFLGREDVNPDKPHNQGRTPLARAAMEGHASVVKQLLAKEGVNPDKPDNEENTPLSWAAMRGDELVVKQLLAKEGVNPDKPDNEGKTPLSWAAIKGHESVVKQLLDKEGVNPDKPDNEGNTPLSWAANKGHESVVKQLLDKEGVNPDKPNNQGNTPLSQAEVGGHEPVVKKLLGREDVNPGKPNNDSRTPLSRAAIRGHESVVKQLLNSQDANPEEPDNEGRIPLLWAEIRGRESVVKLLDREDVNPRGPDSLGRIPFLFATLKGHETVAKQLSGMGHFNPDTIDRDCYTPLSVKIYAFLFLLLIFSMSQILPIGTS